MLKYDCIIVGAGPAGSTLARILDQSKRVLLLDGNRGGKPCGGLLAPDAQKALARFDLTLPKDVLVDPQIFSVKTIDVAAGLTRWYPRLYINVDRGRFDAWLLSLAGRNVEVRRARCRRIAQADGLYRVTFAGEDGAEITAEAPVLVGADGAGSLVRRTFFPALRTRTYVAIQQWFREDPAKVNPFYSCIFDPAATDCCSWSIHKDGTLIFGGAYAPLNCRAAFEAQKKRLEPFGFHFGAPIKTEACLVLRPRGLGSFQCGRGGVYLVGEAAGLISPSSLEGISSAITSATALAASLTARRPQRAYRAKTRSLRLKLALKNLKCPFMYVPFLRALVLRSGLSSIRVVPRFSSRV